MEIPVPKELITAYDRGYDVGKNNRSKYECPYASMMRKEDHLNWMRGHADGMRDRKIGGDPSYTDWSEGPFLGLNDYWSL